jgi:hypothetical protein
VVLRRQFRARRDAVKAHDVLRDALGLADFRRRPTPDKPARFLQSQPMAASATSQARDRQQTALAGPVRVSDFFL